MNGKSYIIKEIRLHINRTETGMNEKKSNKSVSSRTYWIVFALGFLYIILLGLFTYLFNNPI